MASTCATFCKKSPRRCGTIRSRNSSVANSTRNGDNEDMKHHRLARVREVIREVASQTILFDMKDPRVKGVTVTRADVTGDLQHAKIYVSIMGTASEQTLCLNGLR